MTWADARAQLVTILGSVAVTAPEAKTISRVYATPPSTIQDVPSFVIYPPAVNVERKINLRIKHYRVRLRLFVLDAELDVAADWCDNFRESVIGTLDENVTLNGTAVTIIGPDVDEAKSVNYGGRDFTMIDFHLRVEIKTPKDFSA